jgi:hypothetical protein
MEYFTSVNKFERQDNKPDSQEQLLDSVRQWYGYLSGYGNHRGEQHVIIISADKVISLYEKLQSIGYTLTDEDIEQLSYANKMKHEFESKTQRPEDIYGDYEN